MTTDSQASIYPWKNLNNHRLAELPSKNKREKEKDERKDYEGSRLRNNK